MPVAVTVFSGEIYRAPRNWAERCCQNLIYFSEADNGGHFAAGWSACFEGAMAIAGRKMNITLPSNLAIDAEVDLYDADGAFFLSARLKVSLPGLDRDVAQAVVDAAHQTCPYSKATRGNIEVKIDVV